MTFARSGTMTSATVIRVVVARKPRVAVARERCGSAAPISGRAEVDMGMKRAGSGLAPRLDPAGCSTFWRSSDSLEIGVEEGS